MLETRGIVVNWMSDIFHRCCFVYLVYDVCALLIYISLFSVIKEVVKEIPPYFKNQSIPIVSYTARTARFSKKSLGSDVGEIKKMSEKLKKNTAKCPRKIKHGDLL